MGRPSRLTSSAKRMIHSARAPGRRTPARVAGRHGRRGGPSVVDAAQGNCCVPYSYETESKHGYLVGRIVTSDTVHPCIWFSHLNYSYVNNSGMQNGASEILHGFSNTIWQPDHRLNVSWRCRWMWFLMESTAGIGLHATKTVSAYQASVHSEMWCAAWTTGSARQQLRWSIPRLDGTKSKYIFKVGLHLVRSRDDPKAWQCICHICVHERCVPANTIPH
jgi:hypothetical protein